MGPRAIILHGGAGTWGNQALPEARAGLLAAAETGYRLLTAGRSALDACEAAVMALEDNPLFNAGTGAVLNLDGEAELDAAIMDGVTGEAGAIAAVRRVKNPVALARRVMTSTDHVLVVGEGAERLARSLGVPAHDPVTGRAKGRWERQREELRTREGPARGRLRDFLREHPEYQRGTVGCVALDEAGGIAAGGSTGGVALKLAGRVGDTPLIGAGLFASPHGGACATGQGEDIIRTVLCYRVVALVEQGHTPQAAALRALVPGPGGLPSAGVICLSAAGQFGMATTTEHMPTAFMGDGLAAPQFWAKPE